MTSEDFRKLIKDALEHLYDSAYLEAHPLLTQVSGGTTVSRSTRAQGLRILLKDAIEELRPPEGLHSGSPQWRSYLVLRCRYVQGMTMGQVENELGLGRRQLQRETLKGLEALESVLLENRKEKNDALAPTASDLNLSPPDLGNELDPLEIELNQWKLALQVCDLQSLVNDTLWLLQSTMQQHQSDIRVDFPANLPPVFVDATLTRQALFNIMRLILQNSQNVISLTATPDDHFLDIQMRAPVCLPSLEGSDWQAAGRMIRDQGGSLELENNPTSGFQLTIRLPLAGQTRVLVIDDKPAMLQLFERYLTSHHYEVQKTQDGHVALVMAAENPPDLIILDVMMPAMDGWQVLRGLKQNPITENIPIIVCSVLKEPELAISLGARAYLKKPVDRLELLTTLEQVLHP